MLIINSDYENQTVERSTGISEKGVPYTELKIENFLGMSVDVSLRAYTKNIWIAYEDYESDMLAGGGEDLENCYMAPPTLWKKLPIKGFNLRETLLDLASQVMDWDPADDFSGFVQDYIGKILDEVERLKARKGER